MKNISKILILGHSSFLALEIKNFLIDKKIQIITLEKKFDINDILSLNNNEFYKKYFKLIENDIDLMINYLYVHKDNQILEKKINIELIKKIIFSLNEKKIKKHIYISTNRAFNNTKNKYGKIKLECEKIITRVNIDYHILRPSTVIKEYDTKYIGGHKGETIEKLLKFTSRYKILPIPGNGNYIHTYCFVENLNQLIFLMITKNLFINKITNLYSGEKLTFKKFIKVLNKKKIVYIKIPIIFLKIIFKFISFIFNRSFKINKNYENLIYEKIEYDNNIEIKKYINLKTIE